MTVLEDNSNEYYTLARQMYVDVGYDWLWVDYVESNHFSDKDQAKQTCDKWNTDAGFDDTVGSRYFVVKVTKSTRIEMI